MAAVASLLKESGAEVVGSDPFAYPPMGPLLDSLGIEVLPGWDESNLSNRQLDVVVVGNVARRDNPEVVAAQSLGIPLLSMPQLIADQFIGDRTSLVVTGTHGKTTVTSMTAWLLQYAGLQPGFMVGGVPKNFGTGYALAKGDLFVIEGDEYDTAFFDKEAKFFHYKPTHAVMTSLEFDHADIYRDIDHLRDTFRRFAKLVPKNGSLSWCSEYDILEEIAGDACCPSVPYGVGAGPGLRAVDIQASGEGTSFRIIHGGESVNTLLPMWGKHNVQNALAASALALAAGVSLNIIAEGLCLFEGVKRRFDTVYNRNGIVVVDDFAHHPTAVRETLAAARLRFPTQRLFACFHFESNTSRRRVFLEEYSRALDNADGILLTYPLVKEDSLKSGETMDPLEVLRGSRGGREHAGAYHTMQEMADALVPILRPGDAVIAMSGRDFTPLYDELFPRLDSSRS